MGLDGWAVARPTPGWRGPNGSCTKRRGGDSNPRTRLTPVTRFPVAPVQPLRHLSWRARLTTLRARFSVPGSDLPGAVAQQGNLVASAGGAGDRHLV